MSEKQKIMDKLEVRWDRYHAKWLDAKRRKSILLWQSRRDACLSLKSLFSEILCVSYSKGKCEDILRHQLATGLASDTPIANGMVYVLDDIL